MRLGERAARSLRQDTRTLRAGRARGKADVAQLQRPSSAWRARASESLVSLVAQLPVRFYHKGALDEGEAVGSKG